MIKKKKILKEEISESMIRRMIRTEIAKIFFDFALCRPAGRIASITSS